MSTVSTPSRGSSRKHRVTSSSSKAEDGSVRIASGTRRKRRVKESLSPPTRGGAAGAGLNNRSVRLSGGVSCDSFCKKEVPELEAAFERVADEGDPLTADEFEQMSFAKLGQLAVGELDALKKRLKEEIAATRQDSERDSSVSSSDSSDEDTAIKTSSRERRSSSRSREHSRRGDHGRRHRHDGKKKANGGDRTGSLSNNQAFQLLLLQKIESLESALAERQRIPSNGGMTGEEFERIQDRRDDLSDGETVASGYGIPVGNMRKFLYYMLGDGMNEFKITSKAVLLGMSIGSILEIWLIDQILWSAALPHLIGIVFAFGGAFVDHRIERNRQMDAVFQEIRGVPDRVNLVKLDKKKRIDEAKEAIKKFLEENRNATKADMRRAMKARLTWGFDGFKYAQRLAIAGFSVGGGVQAWLWSIYPCLWVRFTVVYTAVFGIVVGLLNDMRIHRNRIIDEYREALDQLKAEGGLPHSLANETDEILSSGTSVPDYGLVPV